MRVIARLDIKNEWVIKGVYAILNYPDIHVNKGVFTRKETNRVWEGTHSMMQDELLLSERAFAVEDPD